MPARSANPAELAIWKSRFASVADEMGLTLGRSAYSPNIKERRDYSCAVFDGEGRLLAQAAHIPVHLGAMPRSVAVAIAHCRPAPGDVVILNDPFLGGTHLPDITLVSVIEAGGLRFYLASRAHHADVGGMAPGSMPLSDEIYQEGLIIPPVLLVRGGTLQPELLDLILRNVRTPEERRGDLDAQLAAHAVGERRLRELATLGGGATLAAMSAALLDYAERLTRAAIAGLSPGEYAFADVLDDDGHGHGPLPIRLCLTIGGGSLRWDFAGTAPAGAGNLNTVRAVTESAVFYAVRCLLPDEAPTNAGCFAPVEVIIPAGCLLDALPHHGVAGGNVETSQRVVDVALGALALALPDRIPAASQGSMNNLTAGGWDPERARPFTYYETVAGGAGAWPGGDGESAVHTHMTNTLNTPIEALEYAYPVRVRALRVRPDSGGAGRWRGGDGVVRALEFLAPATVSLLTERRVSRPYGLAGGAPGAPGANWLIRDGERRPLPAKATFAVEPGDIVEVETPGGGGWGPAHPESATAHPDFAADYADTGIASGAISVSG
jgi:N-methylhydantoinase B